MSEAEMVPNSDILFIYEASMCNPNGDPDDENRPRIDRATMTNLVSDVRLKRFFRNYVTEKFGEEFVWVTKVGGEHVRADKRLRVLVGKKENDDLERSDANEVLKRCIDARLFGATIPIGGKEEGERGKAVSYPGPVQFTWGFSLHPVELIDSPTITSVFMGREEKGETGYGTIGKDWRVYYSLIAFYGVVSSLRSRNTGLRPLDVQILDNLLYKSVNLDATTRSKIGHWAHLYMRVEYNDEFTLGDLRKFVDCEVKTNPVRSFEHVELGFDKLVNALVKHRDKIRAVHIYESDEFRAKYGLAEKLRQNGINVNELPHNININGDLLVIKS
ncbi:MAG: type I-B CRISPR-associated protein Cas7/Csh2 [Nitrososphaerota archaeon]